MKWWFRHVFTVPDDDNDLSSLVWPQCNLYCILGVSSLGKTSYVTEVSQCIVFSSIDPPLVMTYDKILSVHALWRVRNVHPEVRNVLQLLIELPNCFTICRLFYTTTVYTVVE